MTSHHPRKAGHWRRRLARLGAGNLGDWYKVRRGSAPDLGRWNHKPGLAPYEVASDLQKTFGDWLFTNGLRIFVGPESNIVPSLR